MKTISAMTLTCLLMNFAQAQNTVNVDTENKPWELIVYHVPVIKKHLMPHKDMHYGGHFALQFGRKLNDNLSIGLTTSHTRHLWRGIPLSDNRLNVYARIRQAMNKKVFWFAQVEAGVESYQDFEITVDPVNQTESYFFDDSRAYQANYGVSLGMEVRLSDRFSALGGVNVLQRRGLFLGLKYIF